MRFKFNPQKSAQAAAVLLKLNGGDMDKYIFIKMLYLADREALSKWQEPITGDRTASMQYGPVLSTIYDLTKGDCPDLRKEWEKFISDADPETNRVFLKEDPGDDELCKAEVAILQAVHERFKGYTWKQMRDYCHKHLREYEDVGRSSKDLPPERILTALGRSAGDIRSADARLREIQMAEMLLGH
jgi:uncharacterized phage-associated protein